VSNGNLFLTAPTMAQQSSAEARTSQALRALQSKQSNSGKIEKAAREFESILLGEWLQQAEKSFGTVPGSDPDKDADPGHDQFQSIGCEYLAGALSKAGGIGLAKMITKHLEAVAGTQPTAVAAGDEGNHGKVPGAASTVLDHVQVKEKR